MRLIIILPIFLCLPLLGCSTQSYERRLDATLNYLNAREAKGCLAIDTALIGAVPTTITFRGAIGGMDPALCQE